jgi:hypothetical protein
LDVLKDPSDRSFQEILALNQLELKLPDQALYSLNAVPGKETGKLTLLMSCAYTQKEDSRSARELYSRAFKADPSLFKGLDLGPVYKLDEKLIPKLSKFTLIRPSMVVTTRADPSRIVVGRSTTVHVVALTQDRKPIAGANVTIRASGGKFPKTKTAQIQGHTDARGNFRARWVSERGAAMCKFAIEVSKAGFQGAKGETKVQITKVVGPSIELRPGTSPSIMGAGKPTNVSMVLKIWPSASKVKAGDRTSIQVHVLTRDNRNPAKANVTIQAEGGKFVNTGTRKIQGQTDNRGLFWAVWRAEEPGTTYVFSVEVSKAGFQSAKGETKVQTAKLMLPSMVLKAWAKPSRIEAGKRTTVTVRVLTKDNKPIAKANVTIQAKGGKFVSTKTRKVQGQTNDTGYFQAPLLVEHPATACELLVEVSKEGFQSAKKQITGRDMKNTLREIKTFR